MKRSAKTTVAACLAAVAVSAVLNYVVTADGAGAAETKGKPMLLAHNVFFSLKDPTPENRKKLVEACDKYLSDHPGTGFYAAGTLADLSRPVNDRDFDVALHVIFKDRASHDAYQTAPKHLQFVEENKAGWAKVRVFDSDVGGGSK